MTGTKIKIIRESSEGQNYYKSMEEMEKEANEFTNTHNVHSVHAVGQDSELLIIIHYS